MPSQLLQKLRTKEDLDILRGELDTLESALYQTNIKYEDVLKNDIRNWVTELILKESDKEDLKEYIRNVKQALNSIPVLSASVSFEPSESFIEKISYWLKANVDKMIVVDFLLNTASLGGIQLSYKGKYLDLSLRKQITGELEKITLSH